MVNKCVAPHCKSGYDKLNKEKEQSTNLTENDTTEVEVGENSRGKNKHIHSYRFPKDKELFEQWKMLSQEKNGSPALP